MDGIIKRENGSEESLGVGGKRNGLNQGLSVVIVNLKGVFR